MKCLPVLDGHRQRYTGSPPCSLGIEVWIALSPWNVLCILRDKREVNRERGTALNKYWCGRLDGVHSQRFLSRE